MRCKLKMTNWHIWYTGIPGSSNGCSPKGEGILCCVCICVCICVCQGSCLQMIIPNQKNDFLKKLNTPLISKIRHVVTKYVSKQ